MRFICSTKFKHADLCISTGYNILCVFMQNFKRSTLKMHSTHFLFITGFPGKKMNVNHVLSKHYEMLCRNK